MTRLEHAPETRSPKQSITAKSEERGSEISEAKRVFWRICSVTRPGGVIRLTHTRTSASSPHKFRALKQISACTLQAICS